MDAVDRIFELVDKIYKEQRDFAKAAGVSASKVSQWRTRKSKSYTKYIAQIAEALDTSVEYLLSGKEPAAAMRDPLAGLDPDKDYVMVYKGKDGQLAATPMMPKQDALPADAVEVARAYMSRSVEVKNVVRAALGLAPLSGEKTKIG